MQAYKYPHPLITSSYNPEKLPHFSVYLPYTYPKNIYLFSMHPFVHLHVHSQYSLLDGQASIPRLVDKAVGDGMKAIALTDHGAMYGIKEFLNYCNRKNAPVKDKIKKLQQEIKSLEMNGEGSEKTAQLRDQLTDTEKRLFKPIVGCECYLARRDRFSQSEKIDGSGWHLVVLAKNLKGYRNLIKIVSKSWTEGFYYRPRIDKELLEQYSEGLIVSSACWVVRFQGRWTVDR